MPINPDTDAIYQEAIDLQGRIEEYESKRMEFERLFRDVQLELISNGFLPDAAPEIRLDAARFRAHQIIQESHADLFHYLDEEYAAICGIRTRNEAIVAAGWAEQFAYNSETRRLASRWDKPKGDLEA